MNSLPADLHSLCSRSAMELALACAASAALGAALVAALGLLTGERRKSVIAEKKKADFLPFAPTTKPVAATAVAPCCEHEEHDENAAPSSSSAAPASKGDPFDARPRSRYERRKRKEGRRKESFFFFSPPSHPTSRFEIKKKKNSRSYLSWDDYFMALAFLSAQRSKDPNKQVGACIVSPDRIILGIGYNGFPRGCADSKLPWAKKAVSGGALATKYPYVCHAEMNAVLNKNAASVAGATLFVTMFPCNECSKLLIQAGIGEVVFYEDKQAADNGGGAGGSSRPSSPPSGAGGGILPAESYAASRTLLALAGVRTRQHAPAEALVLRVAPLDEAGRGGREGGGSGGVLRARAA